MARKNSSQPKSPVYQGYIPTYLDDKSKKAIKANVPTDEQAFKKVCEWCEDEYRFTLAWSEERECYTASLFDCSFRRPSGGYILAANHVDPLVAIGSLAYLHETVYPEGWDTANVGKHNDVSW